jgi:carboxyl-terminal processing protease
VDGEAEALRERRLAVFDDVWQMVRERYYDAALHGVDWRAAREEFRPLAAGADDQTQLYAVLRRMLARLHDPHTRVFAPDEGFNWREPRLLTVGLSVREIGGELLVVSVVRGSEADATGVRAGDALVSVDGAAAGAMVMRRLEEQNAGLEVASARNIAVARLFEGARDSFAEVVFKSSDAREKRVLLRRTLSARTPTLSMRRVGRGIGVAEFNAFTPEIASELARALRDMRGVDSLVLDLRGNGGGEAEAMTDIASLFLPGGTRLGSFIDRAGRVQSEPQTRRAMLSSAHTVEVFRGSVVVLTGARTASAAEIFVAALKDAGRVRVVGENTCGCVLGIRRRHALLDGGMLDVSEVDFRTARGARLEGTGIAPHETVTPTRRDLYAGRDRVMQRAVEMLKEK